MVFRRRRISVQPSGGPKKRPVKSKKKLLRIVGRASVPARFGLTKRTGLRSARRPTLLYFNEVSYERRLWPRASSQIEKETNEHWTSNVQHRTSNKWILSILKKSERSDSILRHSTFDILRFCGSLLTVVSYKRRRWLKNGQSNQMRN